MAVYHHLTLIAFMLGSALSSNPLNGQHLRVLIMEFPVSLIVTKRNAAGHIIDAAGIEAHMINALSQMFNFSYSYLPINSLLASDSPSARGAISYLMKDEADYYLSSTLASASRLEQVDFPAYWIFTTFSTFMPYPKETFNLAASFDPLSYEVWIVVAVAAIVTILCFKIVLGKKIGVVPYVIGNLVSQGQRHFPNRLAVRLVAGAWCCTTFFLVQIYSSTLTSHLTSPNQKPMINSFFEIADNHRIKLAIDRGYAIDVILQTTESAFLKRFTDTLKKGDRLVACNKTIDCLDQVKSGNVVYSAPFHSLSVLMADDVKRTGMCQYTRTKETFWNTPIYTLLRKNSPYTETMSRGILHLHDTGLLDLWEKWYTPSNLKCLKLNQRRGIPRLSLGHLSSAFVILVAGYLVSMFVFLAEKLFHLQRV